MPLRARFNLGAVAIVVTALCCAPLCGQDATPVVVTRVTEAAIKSGQRVVGAVHPLRTSTIGSALDGRVKEFLVNAGDPVKKGQELALLRTGTYKIELAAAKAELDLSVQRLAELENGSRTEDIAEADANMRRSEAALKFAESKRRRIASLADRDVASADELDDAIALVDAARFSLQASKALHKRIKDGPRSEAIAQAKAQVELQKQRLNLIDDRITKCAIVAPFDGFVAEEFTEVGAWISRGDPIAQVIQMDEIEVRAPVTAEAVVSLRKGDVVRVEFPELPDELLTGKIERIVPVAVSRARTFPVHVRLKNKIREGTPLMMAGMLARVDLPAGRRQTLPLVPKDALVLNGTDRSVFVVDKKGKQNTGTVRKVTVTLGVALGGRIQVRGDIKVGELIVVVGNERLRPKTVVKYTLQKKPSAK